ncbi:MAG: sulfite exporter TauE/SafE family protein, partial [Calditrichia bacterium]|nr:sulfite exporter TauE/SafE family protein [Calditrichia bacterium]
MILNCFIILLTGISVGFVSTIFGIGGGIIMVPLLSLILPFSHLEAIATSLTTIVLVAGFNTFNFSKQNVIVWKIVPWIAVTSSFFAFISARLSTILPEKILVIIFLLFLFYFAMRTFLIRKVERHSVSVSHSRLLPLGIGTISGLISGVT